MAVFQGKGGCAIAIQSKDLGCHLPGIVFGFDPVAIHVAVAGGFYRLISKTRKGNGVVEIRFVVVAQRIAVRIASTLYDLSYL